LRLSRGRESVKMYILVVSFLRTDLLVIENDVGKILIVVGMTYKFVRRQQLIERD